MSIEDTNTEEDQLIEEGSHFDAQKGVGLDVERTRQTRKIKRPQLKNTPEPPKLIGGINFYLITGFFLCIDLLQIIIFFLQLVALGISAIPFPLLIPSMIGFGLTTLFLAILVFMNVSVVFVLLFYCLLEHIPLRGKLKLFAKAIILEGVPVLNIIPSNTLLMFKLKRLENKRRMKKHHSSFGQKK